MTDMQFQGTFTALITPFRDGAVDFDQLSQLVEEQVEAGIDGIVAVGTTGESPTLDTSEHIGVVEHIVRTAAGRTRVIAGAGANSTQEALHLTREAERVGVDALLQVAPYYNKPTQEGIFQHLSAVARITRKPIMLYSIPGRCGVEIAVETVARLADTFEHVRTIKEAGGDVSRVSALRARCGDAVTILSGDDGMTVPFIAAGARGVVSVASNLAPRIVIEMTRHALSNDIAAAREMAERYYRLLTDAVFMEGNPVTIKEALHLSGKLPSPELRLPLVRMSSSNRDRLKTILADLNLGN